MLEGEESMKSKHARAAAKLIVLSLLCTLLFFGQGCGSPQTNDDDGGSEMEVRR